MHTLKYTLSSPIIANLLFLAICKAKVILSFGSWPLSQSWPGTGCPGTAGQCFHPAAVTWHLGFSWQLECPRGLCGQWPH